MVWLSFPLRFDDRGHTAVVPYERHVRDMIEQLLFTTPGERVNRPDLGSGVMQLVFGAASPELASALEFTLQAALQKWLGDVITVDELEVSAEDSTLRITVGYVLLATNERRVDVVERVGS